MPGESRYSAFAHRDFRLLQIARVLGVVALQIQGVTVAWQVLDATHAPLALGAIGLAQFLPLVLAAPLGGVVADRWPRRSVVAASYAVYGLACLVLAASSLAPGIALAPIYATLVVVGAVRAFVGPASSAMLGDIVPEADVSNAIAWSSSTFQVATIAGPAIGGLLYGLAGPSLAYASSGVLLVVAATLVTRMVRRPAPTHVAGADRSIVRGIRFVLAHPVLLAASSLDLVAVILAGAVALLPLVADELHAGPIGLGALRSAPALGAALLGLGLANSPITRRAGPALLLSVAGFGGATIVFGLAPNLLVAFLALLVAGALDMISVFVRQSVVQRSTPNEVRGRVTAVNLLFISASNELGEMESGLSAEWFGVRNAIVLGGVASVLVAIGFGVFSRSLRGLSLASGDEATLRPPPTAPESEAAAGDGSRPS